MSTMSGGNAAPDTIANSLNSDATRSLFINELQRSGLLGAGGTVNFAVVNDAGPVTSIDRTQNPVVIENSGATTFRSTGPILVALGPDASATLATGRGPGIAQQNDTVIGGSGKNFIVGNQARSLLIAGTGKETIQSGHGRDTIVGGSGSNTLIGGGKSLIEAGSGPTSITAGANANAHDTIFAGSGRDTISLTSGNNNVLLGRGKATVQAGSGQDTISGGRGAATITSGAHTTIALGKGEVTLNAPTGTVVNDTIYGGANSGDLKLNIASTAATVTQVSATNQDITFGSGSVIHISGNIHVIFSDQTKTS